LSTGTNSNKSGDISLERVLEVVGNFDRFGGASLGLVAWDLWVEDEVVSDVWQRAQSEGLIAPAGLDLEEQLWRLTPGGWAAAVGRRQVRWPT
jgi:hypothetical protein